MQTSQLIEELASGNASVVKDILNDMLSTKAFESLDAKKIELARNMFNGSEIQEEEVDLDEAMIWHVDKHGNSITKGTLVKNTKTGHIGKASHMGFDDGKPYMHATDPKTKETSWGHAHHYESITKDGKHKVPTYHQGKVNGMGERMSDEQVEVTGQSIEESELNELGPETTVSYINKATKDAHATVAAAGVPGADKDSLRKRLAKRQSGITKAYTKIVRKAKEEQE
jgi:hypothetical protein